MLFDPRLAIGGFIAGFLSALAWFGFAASFHPSVPIAQNAARGALIQPADHPEWQQFLLLAAIRRADELNRLRDLPDRPPVDAAPARIANVPAGAGDVVQDEVTGSIALPSGGAIPLELGEASAVELPILRRPEDERPPAATLKPARSSAVAGKRKLRRTRLSGRTVTPAASYSVGPSLSGIDFH